MIADILLILGIALVAFGVFKRRTRGGAAALGAGSALIVAVLLLTGADLGDSFVEGFKSGYGGN